MQYPEDSEDLGGFTTFDVISFKKDRKEEIKLPVATEVPCTMVVNGAEIATIMCTPTHLREFAVGYLYTSGIIKSAKDIEDFYCDTKKWRLDIKTTSEIDFELQRKKVENIMKVHVFDKFPQPCKETPI